MGNFVMSPPLPLPQVRSRAINRIPVVEREGVDDILRGYKYIIS